MPEPHLPLGAEDVLRTPNHEIPELIRSLIHDRSLSRVVKTIHRDMESLDPALRARGKLALRRMGFED